MTTEITPYAERSITRFPADVQKQFNFDTASGQTIDYHSEPIIYMPDEFAFRLDIESLGRLAREMLIRMIPPYAQLWEPEGLTTADLWIGGRGEAMNGEERRVLMAATEEVWNLPVQGRIFVLGSDIDNAAMRAGLRMG